MCVCVCVGTYGGYGYEACVCTARRGRVVVGSEGTVPLIFFASNLVISTFNCYPKNCEFQSP